MKYKHLLDLNLHIFEGGDAGGAAAGAAAASAAEGGATTGETSTGAVPGAAGRGKTTGEDLSKVIYGKPKEQPKDQQSDAGSDDSKKGDAAPDTQQSKEQLRNEFNELMRGKFKDIYTEETQRIIDRRFSSAKETESRMQTLTPALATLADYYGIKDDGDYSKLAEAIGKDDTFIGDAADEAGMSAEAYREVQRIKRENAAFKAARENDVRNQKLKEDAQRLKSEGDALKAKYPKFDLREFMADRNSMAAFLAGQPMENVYWASHHDELLADEISKARSGAVKSTVDNIRAKGTRPAENGTSSQGAPFITKSDPSKYTLHDFEEIARRVRNGEMISF